MRRSPLGFLALLPLVLAGCSVTWSLAATESEGRAVVHLPTCSTKSVERIQVVEQDGFRPVWEIEAAAPVFGVRQFVIGDSVPGFVILLPLSGGLVEGTAYSAEIHFGGQAGPFASVDFTIGDLAEDSWWFDNHPGTPEEFESAARSTGLCGGSDFSWKDIFRSKFGVGLAIVLVALLALVGWKLSRRRGGAVRIRS